MIRSRRVGRFGWLIGFHAAVFLVLMAEPAGADNCQTFTDCFLTADAATDAALGMAFLGMLSMGLNFVPYVGTAKGIVEAFAGRDLLTGQELSMSDRLLGLIPGGLGRGGRLGQLGRMPGMADDMADMGRVTRLGPPPPPPRPRLPDAPRPRVPAGAGGGGTRPGGAPPPRARGGGAGPDDTLVRQGSRWESANRLDRQARAAEEHGFGHGVSVTTPESNARLSRDPSDASMATRRAFEDAGFPVHHTPTARDPNHHTVELPDPVTPEDARRFNEVLGRTRR